jgi:hypothetical protein
MGSASSATKYLALRAIILARIYHILVAQRYEGTDNLLAEFRVQCRMLVGQELNEIVRKAQCHIRIAVGNMRYKINVLAK